MSALYLDVLQLPVQPGVFLLLADDTVTALNSPLESLTGLPPGWLGRKSAKDPKSPKPQERPAIVFDDELSKVGMHPAQIHELRTIYWDIIVKDYPALPKDFAVRSSVQDSARAQDWRPKMQPRAHHGTMAFINYLGAAWLEIKAPQHAGDPFKFHFDVITAKLDYASEYKTMVEAIGNQCHQLLLEWNSPTSVNISQDNFRHSQTLLEQFLFLRHVLGPDRLELFLEVLLRQPHSRLLQERSWQTSATAAPMLFIRDPLKYGRDWQVAPAGRAGMVANWNAAEIVDERKYDSTDTPPNRFIKFALETFRSVCDDVIDCEFTEPGPPKRTRILRHEQGAAWQEAVQMRNTIDSFLAAPFFREVGRLSRVPYESQTLQKREGYREILHAFLMLDAAAQIDWPGRNDAYDGTNRDVATLYEFWLYFVLVRFFEKDLKMQREADQSSQVVDDARPFCCTGDDGRMMIHLKRDEASFCRFTWKSAGGSLRLHFFYNRQFKRSEVQLRGTYSKIFRPDFSLVIIPGDITESDWDKAEQCAEQQGRIAYLHFDAKYRVDRLSAVLGDAEEETTDERRAAKAAGKFKNEDLYKMHTYAEAIRRTIGAYVLYPGDDPMNERNQNRFERYHEIIPGVGAFALRPNAAGENADPAGLPFFRVFLEKILTHQVSKFTQSHRINFWTHETIKDGPPPHVGPNTEAPVGEVPPLDVPVVVGYIRAEAQDACRRRTLFYFHAIESDGTPTAFDQTILQARLLVPYGRNQWLGWYARIKSCRLVRRVELIDRMGKDAHVVGEAQFYYLMELEDGSIMDFGVVPALPVPRPGVPQLKQWPDLFPPIRVDS